jgi:hypothetical protein
MKLTPTLLRKNLGFDESTGLFVWKVHRGRQSPGTIAGALRSNGQCVITLYGEHHTSQRLEYFWHNGRFPSKRVKRRIIKEASDPHAIFCSIRDSDLDVDVED